MLLKYFYDTALAHASYLVGCQRTGEAMVIDPGRHIDAYLETAAAEGVKIVAACDTHIHADYVSGIRELAARVGATLYVSDAGPKEWKYEFLSEYPSRLLREGERFSIGHIDFDVWHTPGHTPESISLMLTDRGGGADQPMGIFTGDFLFVGAVGRPDLLEAAVNMQGTAVAGARELFQSVQRLKDLPDYLQIWPAHGAGSACGKGLGAIPSSTLGYEKRFNPGLQFDSESAFVDYILADQPEAPRYFAIMKRVNREGPQLLGPETSVPKLDLSPQRIDATQTQLLDLAPAAEFLRGHIPGSLHLPPKFAATWGGWLVDYSRPVTLIGDTRQVQKVARTLREIGVDQIEGYLAADEVAQAGMRTETIAEVNADEAAEKIRNGKWTLLDVRSQDEWNSGHVREARHGFLGNLPQALEELQLDNGQTVVVQCRSGARSVVGASCLQRAGIKNVVNLSGGITAWRNSGLPVESSSETNAAAAKKE